MQPFPYNRLNVSPAFSRRLGAGKTEALPDEPPCPPPFPQKYVLALVLSALPFFPWLFLYAPALLSWGLLVNEAVSTLQLSFKTGSTNPQNRMKSP
jgi:hypothetical protein